VDGERRKVARDGYVSWQGCRYSVPWRLAGKEVWVRDRENDIEIRYETERGEAVTQRQIVTEHEHQNGINLTALTQSWILPESASKQEPSYAGFLLRCTPPVLSENSFATGTRRI
jgi:hypothetical protein